MSRERFWRPLIRDTVRAHGWPVTIACAICLPFALAWGILRTAVGMAGHWAEIVRGRASERRAS